MSCDNNDDDEGLELLQRARLLVQAATNLPDFSTLFSKRSDDAGGPHHDETPSSSTPVVAPKPKKTKTAKPKASNQHDTNTDQYGRDAAAAAPHRPSKPPATDDTAEPATKPRKPSTRQEPSHAPDERVKKPKKATKPKSKPDATNDGGGPEVDDAERRAAQALARKYAQERAAARVATKLREKMAEAEKEEQSQAECVHEFYETLDEKEQRLKMDRIRAKDRIVRAKQAKEVLDAKHADDLPPPHAAPEQLEKFQKQTKERLLKAKEAKRQAQLLQQAKERQEAEEKAKAMADEAASADEAKRRAEQVRRETKRRLKAMQAHKEQVERQEIELRQQGLDKYKHHKGEMERVAKGGAAAVPSSVSKPSKQPPAPVHEHGPDDGSAVATEDSPPDDGEALGTAKTPSDNNEELSHGEPDDEVTGQGERHTIVLDVEDERHGKVDLPPLVAPSAETVALPLKKVVQKKALWKRPPVPIPTVDEIAHRSKQAMPPVAPAVPPRHDTYADRMKSRSAPSSLNSQAERLASATRERAKQMDMASAK